MTTAPDSIDRPREAAIRRDISRAVTRARLVLLWEALWPRFVPLVILAGLFVLASLLGYWTAVPDWLRIVSLTLFCIAGLLALWPMLGLRLPDPEAGFARLERTAGQRNHPATAFLDHLATQHGDDATRAIWSAHRARIINDFTTPRVGPPSPGVAMRDPYALRFLLVLVLAVTLVATGGSVLPGISDAFRSNTQAAAAATVAETRVDAWASPPDYTGRPAIFLTGDLAQERQGGIEVLAGTELFVRVAGERADNARVEARSTAGDTAQLIADGEGEGPSEFKLTLSEDIEIAVVIAGRERNQWAFAVMPDEPPEIVFTAPPSATANGALQADYAFTDDYGVANAHGEIALTDPAIAVAPLYEPPEFPITIPRSRHRDATGTAIRDLREHPWAGLDVIMTLLVEDVAGQQGRSETFGFALPARDFTDATAIALVTERRRLALDAGAAEAVTSAIDELAVSAEASGAPAGIYLALRSAYHRLVLADSDDLLREAADYLWALAVGIEGNLLADAAEELQAATEALREAMARDAGEEEIAQLSQDVREAMQAYLEELANSDRPRNEVEQPPPLQERELTGPELQDLLDRIEELAQRGDMETAEELLNRLEQMTQNLESAQAEGIQPQFGEAELGNLAQMLQDQQRLMDETFALRQQQNAPYDNAQTPEDAQQLRDELRQRREDQAARAAELEDAQNALEGRLQDLIYELLNQELDIGDLPAAGNAMEDAADLLGETRAGEAVQRQAEALGQLRAVAEAIAAQIAQRQQGDGPNDELGGGAQDPLGRPGQLDGEQGDLVDVPDEIDPQLARQILDLIRQRLNEPGRPPVEIDYLERLLNGN